jgi:hypothetical protein
VNSRRERQDSLRPDGSIELVIGSAIRELERMPVDVSDAANERFCRVRFSRAPQVRAPQVAASDDEAIARSQPR